MSVEQPSTVRQLFINELKKRREGMELSRKEFSQLVQFSPELVSSVEHGRRNPTREFIEACDRALSADGSLSQMWRLLVHEGHPQWFAPLVELETKASRISTFQPLLVPGWMQTPEYAAALFAHAVPEKTPEHQRAAVERRIERQGIFESDALTSFWVVLDEAALRRRVGGAAVMAAQLEKLLSCAEHSKIQLQVISSAVGFYPGLEGMFTILDFRDDPTHVYVETAIDGEVAVTPERVAMVRQKFDTIRALALPPLESVQKLEAILEETQ